MLKKCIRWDKILYLIIQIFSLISKCTPWLLMTRYSRSLKTTVLWTIRIRSMSMISTMIIPQDVRFSLTRHYYVSALSDPSAAQQEEMLLQLAIEQSLREQNASQLSPDAADNHPTDSLHNLYDPSEVFCL